VSPGYKSSVGPMASAGIDAYSARMRRGEHAARCPFLPGGLVRRARIPTAEDDA
jgi:hypothetical protein